MKRIRLFLAWWRLQRALSAYRESEIHKSYAIDCATRGDELERRARALRMQA